MRLFTGIDIPDHVLANLSGLLEGLRPTAKITWPRVEKLHVTTKFIGEWPETRLEQMKRALKTVGSPGPITISVRGLGWFPNPRSPRVFWAGIESGPELEALAHSTEKSVEAIGVPKEDRKYSPHLTLARIKERVSLDALRRAIDKLPSVDFGSFPVTSFFLYLSAGGRYTKLAEFPLA
jgi:2'-5' RNA ligase